MQTYVSDVPDGTTNILQDNINGRNNENTLRSNFSGTAFPDTPVAGQHCYRTDTGIEYIYDGTAWIEVAAKSTLGLDVTAAKGTLNNLSSRLNVSINPDGTLKDPTTANVDEFKVSNVTPTYVDETTFSVPDDLTGIFTAGRILKITDGAEVKYLSVVSSAFDTVTNVVVDGTITASISAVDYSLAQYGLPKASETVKGVVELATPDEVKQGTDNERVVTPAGFKAAFGEFYPTGLTPTYVDANNFSVTGDQTAIFTQGRVLKITDTGGTVYAVVSASVYDTVTTVTIAGDTIDSGISAVLYAVSQQTSAIWESGSNSNGEYIKFADGTMICYLADMALVYSSAAILTYTWTYPAAFSNVPAILKSMRGAPQGADMPVVLYEIDKGISSCKINSFSSVSGYISTDTQGVSATAIGRWF